MQIGQMLLWFAALPLIIALIMYGIVRLEMSLMVKLINVNISRKIRFYIGIFTFVSVFIITLALAISKAYI